ncbi:MAG: hypothetical protein M1826_005904 [Phylliscum demangeonii]|nr:MAG: hypothetical protein M1826_005904 [Phylliscum demangeonii]
MKPKLPDPYRHRTPLNLASMGNALQSEEEVRSSASGSVSMNRAAAAPRPNSSIAAAASHQPEGHPPETLFAPATASRQSLNFLTGLLLLFMNEEKVFWMPLPPMPLPSSPGYLYPGPTMGQEDNQFRALVSKRNALEATYGED